MVSAALQTPVLTFYFLLSLLVWVPLTTELSVERAHLMHTLAATVTYRQRADPQSTRS